MKSELLHNLIDLAEEFDQENTSVDIKDFAIWLSGKYFKSESDGEHKDQLDLMLAFQISMLNKSIKKHTKEIISDSPLSSLDGYSFLLHLEQMSSLRKMELIEMHNVEAPTGIEILKRLLAKELIEEFNDEEDRRAKRVKITKLGLKELNKLKPLVDKSFSSFGSPLNLNDKLVLIASLKKLIQA